MNPEDAQREAAHRNRERPPGSRHRWFARADGNGEWSLLKVGGLIGVSVDPLKAAIEAKPKPSLPDDPRPVYLQNIGGPWAG